MLDVPGSGDVRVGHAVDLAAHEPNDGRGRHVLGAHQRQRTVRAEVAPPRLGNPVRVRVRNGGLFPRRVRQGFYPGAALVGEPAENGVRERHGPLEPRPADELDRLVDGRVAGHAVEEDELVGAEPERRTHGGIETADRPPAGDLDRVVERAGALHRAVRELPRERPVAIVEAGGGPPQRPVGVRLVLEDAADDVEGGHTSGCDRRAPSAKPAEPGSGVHPLAAVRLHLERLECSRLPHARLPDRHRTAVQLGARADVRRERTDLPHELDGRALRGRARGLPARSCRHT